MKRLTEIRGLHRPGPGPQPDPARGPSMGLVAQTMFGSGPGKDYSNQTLYLGLSQAIVFAKKSYL
jgi:hypothetical protein